jgi:hypothetical protein
MIRRLVIERFKSLRSLSNIPGHRKHEAFRTELAAVYRRGQERGLATFLSEIEAVVRGLQPAPPDH